jgi:hypothetical protein
MEYSSQNQKKVDSGLNNANLTPIITISNKKEIFWNLINSAIAGGLVFLGGLSTGNLNKTSVIVALVTSGIIAFNKFRDYWVSEKNEYCEKPLLCLFKFI